MDRPKLTVVTWDAHEEWSALYINGKLDRVGDRYLTDERIAELVGVEYIDADFLGGGNTRNDAFETLDGLHYYNNEIAEAHRKAETLRAQAAELIRRANELDG